MWHAPSNFKPIFPFLFLGKCILIATYLTNHTPSPLIHRKYPYELLHGTTPNYKLLRTFDCPCYIYITSLALDKFHPRSRKCIFVGCSFSKHGWRDFYLKIKQFSFQRCDVKHIFPNFVDWVTNITKNSPNSITSFQCNQTRHMAQFNPLTAYPST